MILRRRLTIPLALLGAVSYLTSCSNGGNGVTIPPGYDQLDSCDAQVFDVDDLVSVGEPGCDVAGSSLRFADGTVRPIFAVGSVSAYSHGIGSDEMEYLVVNWGVPGVGAAMVKNGVLRDVWANGAEAHRLQCEQLRLDKIDADSWCA